LPFDIAPVQIAFIIIEKSEELINYYQEIYEILSSVGYRCQLYNKSSRVNLNILQADKEGCPFKVILGKEELAKEEITLVRRDNVERRITVSLKDDENEKKHFFAYEKHIDELGLVNNKEVMMNSIRKGFKQGSLFRVITKEVPEFQKYLSQKSTEFRDSHIYSVDNFSELEEKIKFGINGLFLIPFCNNSECEEKIKSRVLSYSIRCIPLLEKENMLVKNCLFCQKSTSLIAYLGRSY
jgi:prolyl-tRNA synthetase